MTPASVPASAAEMPGTAEYVLRLYVSGATPASSRAVVNTRRFCEQHLQGRYSLEILSISEHIARAVQDQVIAAPTLLRVAPLPVRRFIGDMSNTERMLQDMPAPAAGALPP